MVHMFDHEAKEGEDFKGYAAAEEETVVYIPFMEVRPAEDYVRPDEIGVSSQTKYERQETVGISEKTRVATDRKESSLMCNKPLLNLSGIFCENFKRQKDTCPAFTSLQLIVARAKSGARAVLPQVEAAFSRLCCLPF